VKVEVTTAPSLDFSGGTGLRYAISIDDEPPQTVNINAGESKGPWERWVADDANLQTSTHLVKAPGAHLLKLWMIDPGVVFERFTVATGELPASYLGPPESPRGSAGHNLLSGGSAERPGTKERANARSARM
jgi:hypothetical protein